MILDQYELRMLAREMNSPACEMFEFKLRELYNARMLNNHNILSIPKFWCETVFYGLQGMIEEFPNLKFGSIIEVKSRLRIYSIPTSGAVEMLKVKLYNKIDTLVLDTIDNLLKGDKKPFFIT